MRTDRGGLSYLEGLYIAHGKAGHEVGPHHHPLHSVKWMIFLTAGGIREVRLILVCKDFESSSRGECDGGTVELES
jgi:hypothetical protein